MHPLQLELEAFVNCHMDCREENLGPSARAVSALKLQSHLRINISNILDTFRADLIYIPFENFKIILVKWMIHMM